MAKMLLVLITAVFLGSNFKVEAALSFKDQCLKWHNTYRMKHQAGPVTWDDNLAKAAEDWAKYLANNNFFKRDPNMTDGENLYLSSNKPDEPCTAATKACYGQVKYHDFQYPGYSKKAKHFAKVVWKNTKQIGAAQAIRKDGKLVVVIRYSPPGNFASKTAFMKNVLPVQEEHVLPVQEENVRPVQEGNVQRAAYAISLGSLLGPFFFLMAASFLVNLPGNDFRR